MRHTVALLCGAVMLLLAGGCLISKRQECISRAVEPVDAARPVDEIILIPMTTQRDRLHDWDYVDGADCEVATSQRRLRVDAYSMRMQARRDDSWADGWSMPLANVISLCRFHWHELNPPEVLDGLDLKLQGWVPGVGDKLNLQAIKASCAIRLLDALEGRLRQQGTTSLPAPQESRPGKTARDGA
jgi:hypothetical protein